jgi:hypothetical protein
MVHQDAPASLVPRNGRRKPAAERDGVPKRFQFGGKRQKLTPFAPEARHTIAEIQPEVRAVSLPFGFVGTESNGREPRHVCVRVSTKLAMICGFLGWKSRDQHDNQIAHGMQRFSHLLN